jgi:hypothetical protein
MKKAVMNKMFKLILQLHGGGKGSTTNVQSYQPTPEERRLMDQAARYSEAVAPNALRLNDTARDLLWESLGSTKVDFDALNNGAQGQIASANNTVAGLVNGQLPLAYQQNMEAAIKRGVNNSMGTLLTDLGSRGVINSSVMNTGVQGINDAAANAMSDAYQQNIGLLSGLAGQQTDQATARITAGAAAQEAAQQPALNLWNASMGLNQGGTGTALAGVSGKGTTTTTQSNNGNGWLSGVGGLFGGIASAWCFAEDTMVKMADGIAKKIRYIKVGDEVICPHKDGTESVETVTEVMEPHHAEVYIVVAKDRENREHHCYTTMTQPLLCADGKFAQVKNFGIGKELYGGWRVISVIHSGERKVYDLKVSGENNYYADGFIAKGGTNEW